MRVNLAIAADGVQQRYDHKYNIQGIFTEVVPETLPVVIPRMNVVVGFEANVREVGRERAIEVLLQKADGELMVRLSYTHRVPPTPRPGSPSFFVLVFPFDNVIFDEAGPYEFVIGIDRDISERNVPIYVNEPPK